MAGSILMALLALTYASRILGSPTDSASVMQVSSSNDLYSESPCELRSLSTYKDTQGNIWGVGDGNLWWFNATNLSWSLLPLPNGSASSDPWRVACGDPRKYVAVVGRNATLVLHLPWQHWQFVDTDDVSLGYVDKDATWCVLGYLFGIDPLRETLYLLDPEEAHWTVKQDLPVMNNVNWSTPLGVVNTWVGYDGELILVERFGDYRHVMYTNSSGISWVVMGEDTPENLWPNLDQSARSLAWNMGSDRYWLWKDDNGVAELWSFKYNTTEWERGSREFAKHLPSLSNVLTAWEDDDRYCILKRSSQCTAQYSISHTECWTEDDMIYHGSESDDNDAARLTTSSTTDITIKTEKGTHSLNYTSTSRVISPPITTHETVLSSSTSVPEILSPMKPIVTKHAPKASWQESQSDKDNTFVITVTKTATDWHHSTVFGSMIFFGTSLSIFSLVGIFFCVRKCVHFPKEALLLRDPPSVRYTAIPDSLGYDSRKPTPATYTVIPDSIA